MLKKNDSNEPVNVDRTESLLYRLFNKKAISKMEEDSLEAVHQDVEDIVVQEEEESEQAQETPEETRDILVDPSEDFLEKEGEVDPQTGKIIPIDAAIKVSVDRDKISASVYVQPPRFGGLDITFQQLADALHKFNITYGIDEDQLNHIADNLLYSRNIIIAQGVDAIHGADGEVKELYSREHELKLVSKEDGTIDFKNLHIVNNINVDEVICEITPHTNGIDGMDVLGVVIKAIPGKDAYIPKGDNTKLSDDKTKLLAEAEGHLVYSKNNFHIKNIFEVPGNVDNSIGNIDFSGDVVIHGDVFEGYEIRCKGNIVVHGMVEGASIYAQGNITLMNGINGMRKGILESQGGITSKFIENCTIRAKETIAAQSIINSTVFCDSKLVVTAKKGVIVGGSCTVFSSVEANIIGTQSNLPTSIILGATPTVIAEKNEIEEQLKQFRKDIEGIQKDLLYLDYCEKQDKLSSERQKQRQKLNKQKIITLMNDGKLRSRLEEINSTIDDVSDSTVSCRKIFPPTKIAIGNASTTTKTIHERCVFYNKDGEIQIRYK